MNPCRQHGFKTQPYHYLKAKVRVANTKHFCFVFREITVKIINYQPNLRKHTWALERSLCKVLGIKLSINPHLNQTAFLWYTPIKGEKKTYSKYEINTWMRNTMLIMLVNSGLGTTILQQEQPKSWESFSKPQKGRKVSQNSVPFLMFQWLSLLTVSGSFLHSQLNKPLNNILGSG